MQKLSRTEKYREYRNKLNNDGEREIATKELKELQEKIIFNEKRFGNSSRTESDLNRGKKDATYDNIFGNLNEQSQKSYSNDLDDVFDELNKYKKYKPGNIGETSEKKDDYIQRIKEIVNMSNVQRDYKESHDEPVAIERQPKEEIPNEDNKKEEIKLDKIDKPLEEYVSNEEPFSEEEREETQKIIDELNQYSENKDIKKENLAEFVEEEPQKVVVESQLKNVEIKKPVIKTTNPQIDQSKEFGEICANVNLLAEEIESSNSFGEDQYIPKVSNHVPENSLEGIQNNIKKDLIGSNSNSSFLSDLEEEVNNYNSEDNKQDDNIKKVNVDEKKKIFKKSEISGQQKEDYDNTVSLQVDKLMGEIKSSKADNISPADIIKGNNIAKKTIEDNSGKTIAFEINKNNEIPDNTIVLSRPNVEDSSIHTMSFKTEELDIEENDNGNTILNVILGVLILIAFVALGVIVYFFLITRGII